MDEKRAQEIASMIRGIALKASKQLFDRTPDDIEQDLWVKFLETEKKKGYELDLPLIARISWDYVKDMIDYDIRRSHSTVDLSGTSDQYDALQDDEGDFLGLRVDGDFDKDIALDDLYNKFPDPKSKERIFLDFWGNASGAHPNNNPYALPPESRKQGGYTESKLAKLLGYPEDQGSAGYRTFRNKMRNLIADYYA